MNVKHLIILLCEGSKRRALKIVFMNNIDLDSDIYFIKPPQTSNRRSFSKEIC